MLGCLAGHEHGAGDVGCEDGIEALAVHIHEVFERAQACVVDQDVEVIEFPQDFPVCSSDVVLVGGIRANGMRLQRFRRFRQPPLVASRYGDARPCGGQYLRDCAPYAATSARNQYSCVLQIHLPSVIVIYFLIANTSMMSSGFTRKVRRDTPSRSARSSP